MTDDDDDFDADDQLDAAGCLFLLVFVLVIFSLGVLFAWASLKFT